MVYNLGIIEQKKIIETLKKFYALDFIDYSKTAFKNRILTVMNANNLNFEKLISEIEQNTSFKINFLRSFYVPETELFRDPSVWRDIKNNILSKIEKPLFKIWIPDFNTGDEVFTLAIILNELNLLDKVKVYISSNSHETIDEAGFGFFSEKHFAVDEANYKRYTTNENKSLHSYFNLINNNYVFDKKYIRGFKFINKGIGEYNFTKMDLIIYRNKFLYYNLSLQDRILRQLYDNLLPGGFLVIGVKETTEYNTIKDNFSEIFKGNSIYKKIK